MKLCSAKTRRSARALGSALLVLGLAMFPAVGAALELGAALTAIDRMHREAEGPPTMEPVATYEVDSSSGQAMMRLHSVAVRR